MIAVYLFRIDRPQNLAPIEVTVHAESADQAEEKVLAFLSPLSDLIMVSLMSAAEIREAK